MNGQTIITLKHLLINQQRMIGLQFYPDKVVQALVKELPDVKWSPKYNMVVVPNSKTNLRLIFAKFKGTAWIDGEDFFRNKPKEWLFVGQTGGQYSTSSIWKIFDRLKKQYNIDKKGSVHILRHTFATNLLETGTDVRYIQSLLGHNSLKTTQIYTHVANNELIKIKSPMDNLDI